MKRNPWLVGVSAILLLTVFGGLAACTLGIIPERTQQPTPAQAPPEQNPTKTKEPAQPTLKDIAVKLDELPTGWHLIVLDEGRKSQYITKGIQALFVNKKNASPEEQIWLSNIVGLCDENQAAVYLSSKLGAIKTEEEIFDSHPFQSIPMGSDGFLHERIHIQKAVNAQKDEIFSKQYYLCFIQGKYYVELEYYGRGLRDITKEQNFEFMLNLARKIAARIPG